MPVCVKSIYRELDKQVQQCVSQDLGRWVPELYSKTSCGQMLGPDAEEGAEERAKGEEKLLGPKAGGAGPLGGLCFSQRTQGGKDRR